jgi:hypothetical protein
VAAVDTKPERHRKTDHDRADWPQGMGGRLRPGHGRSQQRIRLQAQERLEVLQLIDLIFEEHRLVHVPQRQPGKDEERDTREGVDSFHPRFAPLRKRQERNHDTTSD